MSKMMPDLENLKDIEFGMAAYTAQQITSKWGRPSLRDVVFLGVTAYVTRDADIDSDGELTARLQNIIVEEDICNPLVEFAESHWGDIKKLASQYGQKVLLALTLYYDGTDRNDTLRATPNSVARLAVALLDPQPSDTVLDTCVRAGNFLVYSAQSGAYNIYGSALDNDAILITRLRLYLLTRNIENIAARDILEASDLRATKIFVDYPWGTRLIPGAGLRHRYIDWLPYFDHTIRINTLDWAFIVSAIARCEPGGRVVVAVPTAILGRARSEARLRAAITRDRRLMAVIALPERMYAHRSGATSLLVFGDGCETVRMIDATSYGASRGQTLLTDDDIAGIVSAMHTDSYKSITVDLAELERNDYNWTPARYLSASRLDIKNAVALKDIAESIRSGINLSPAVLEEQQSDTPTGYRYLIQQNIVDNELDEEGMGFLSCIKDQQQSGIVDEWDLVLSRTTPFKVAVSRDDEAITLATANLYIITLDRKRVNPIYVMLYLRSAEGQQQLTSLASGRLASLARSDIELIQIPLLPLAEQNRIANEYDSLASELYAVKQKESSIYARIDKLV